MIGPVALLLIAALFAGVAHLASVLAMPWLAPRDGYARLAEIAPENQMAVLPEAQLGEILPFADPSVAVAVCRYGLDKGPVRIRVAVGATPLALLLMRHGVGIYHSVTDKAATQGVLEVVVATEEQMDQITELDVDDEPVQEIRVVSREPTGVALLRGLAPLPSQRADVEQRIGGATCEVERLADQE